MAIRKVNFEDIDSLINVTAKFMCNNGLNDLEGGHGKESYFYKIVEINNGNNFNEKTVFNLHLPKVILTDFSWAKLHATMKVFNNMDVISYLKLSFQLLFEEKEYALRPINTMIYICSTHFLKNVNDDAMKELKYKNDENSNDALKLFLDAFYLLQNSVCINQFIK
ncbi:unnamed protein product [Brachionus calyciflorus]|uniref:Uncharacterized protein n=1 Tax=Brachionus calyciflorus TaxID=104777 RepID=A0A813SS65_9BILA|nr:unnamed protein product [Brachionus calyciflorus]